MKKPLKPHGPRMQQQPDGAVRQSQMVTTYGPGSMVDLLNDAVLVGGLDFWSYDREFAPPHIDEPRLRDAIVSQFKQLGRELSHDHPFRAPPVGNDREPSKFAGIQVLEFPQWFVCQNPECRALQRTDGLELKSHRYWHHARTTHEVGVRAGALRRRLSHGSPERVSLDRLRARAAGRRAARAPVAHLRRGRERRLSGHPHRAAPAGRARG